MNPSHRIYLVRHGETEWSLSGQHTGNTDIPLTERGRAQAEALGQFFRGRPFARVWSSPLARALDTCQLAGYGAVAECDDDLREWNYGVYEGKTTDEIQQRQSGWSVWESAIPEGESADAVAARARRVLQRVEATDGDCALFAHGHFLRILIAVWLGLPATAGRLFALRTASVSVLGWEHATRVLQVLNQVPGEAP